MVKATLFIEQPIKRAAALSRPVTALAEYRPVIIDESDGELSSFPTALTLGYAGVSSKNCKGFYKSILNAARVAAERRSRQHALLHVGRGSDDLAGHQRAAGSRPGVAARPHPCRAQCPPLHRRHVGACRRASRRPSWRAHPALYEKLPGKPARLKAKGGTLALGSLGCPGFAVGVDLDFKSMRPMPAAPRERLKAADMNKLPDRFELDRGAGRLHDRAVRGADRRSRRDAGRHHGAGRRRQDGSDAGAAGQARGARTRR